MLARRYLRHETYAQPIGWTQAGEDMATVTGDPTWNGRRVERLVGSVRMRLREELNTA